MNQYIGEQVLIPGPAGKLEAQTEYPRADVTNKPIVICCHPHPLHGGSMTNKVVYILSRTFVEMGLPALRFNFRGVGLSDGSFDNGDGECEDLLAAVKWFQGRHPDAPVWLAGFSFGAYVAMRAYQSIDAQRLLLVAPPVTKYEFEAQANVSIPWVVIQGGVDEVISPEAVSTWVHQQILAPEYIWLADADHFFHGRLNNLREAVKGAWGTSLAACD